MNAAAAAEAAAAVLLPADFLRVRPTAAYVHIYRRSRVPRAPSCLNCFLCRLYSTSLRACVGHDQIADAYARLCCTAEANGNWGRRLQPEQSQGWASLAVNLRSWSSLLRCSTAT